MQPAEWLIGFWYHAVKVSNECFDTGQVDQCEIQCPLCNSLEIALFYREAKREYLTCCECELVFVPPAYFLSRDAEKSHYDQHENDPADPRYRHFLNRLAVPLIQNLAAHAEGLDFGCGPGPTLSLMMSEAGFPTTLYDSVYQPNSDVWMSSYDFITASEVVEHLHRPRFELRRLWSCLRVGGVLGIMTKRRFENQSFAKWHYKDDPTHVSFFSDATFQWIGRYFAADLQIIGPDVVLLTRLAE